LGGRKALIHWISIQTELADQVRLLTTLIRAGAQFERATACVHWQSRRDALKAIATGQVPAIFNSPIAQDACHGLRRSSCLPDGPKMMRVGSEARYKLSDIENYMRQMEVP
jgi:hypothetical protein